MNRLFSKVCINAQKMRMGPTQPACRSRLKTTQICAGGLKKVHRRGKAPYFVEGENYLETVSDLNLSKEISIIWLNRSILMV